MGLLALLVIVLIALALFAPGKLTGAGGMFGHAVRAFKEGLNGETSKGPRKPEKTDKR
jgi:TatA/E family protein of Tat protein translocase